MKKTILIVIAAVLVLAGGITALVLTTQAKQNDAVIQNAVAAYHAAGDAQQSSTDTQSGDAAKIEALQAQLASLNEQELALEQQEDALERDYAAGGLTREEYRAQERALEQQEDALERQEEQSERALRSLGIHIDD